MASIVTLFSYIFVFLQLLLLSSSENPYRFFTWNVTYGDIAPLGFHQRGILINNQFPGPLIDAVTNDNLIINVFNNLDEPFLITWNGIYQRKNSWQDGVYGTNCPILPNTNYTYILQMKDQIGSFFYFPSLSFHKAAGGYGSITLHSRPQIPVPFSPPADDFTLLAGDWFNVDHADLRSKLDSGDGLPPPSGLIINGLGSNRTIFTVDGGKTYRFRVSNVGIATSINLMIQGHNMLLVEVEGTHCVQSFYSSIDIHVGQSYSFLVTMDQQANNYQIVVTSRFSTYNFTTYSVLHYSNSTNLDVPPILVQIPPGDYNWSMNQSMSFRQNLTASGPRPNPQGTFHYGQINVTRNIRLENNVADFNGKRRYTVNGVSFVAADTPLKLADYFNISGVFTVGSVPDLPGSGPAALQPSVIGTKLHDFVEFVFENPEEFVQSWHLDGYMFYVVGMGVGKWSEDGRSSYNLNDAITRSTVPVFPGSWTAILVSLDNVGMWNLRSQKWGRQYLGQQLYVRVFTTENSTRNENPIPTHALLCGRASSFSVNP